MFYWLVIPLESSNNQIYVTLQKKVTAATWLYIIVSFTHVLFSFDLFYQFCTYWRSRSGGTWHVCSFWELKQFSLDYHGIRMRRLLSSAHYHDTFVYMPYDKRKLQLHSSCFYVYNVLGWKSIMWFAFEWVIDFKQNQYQSLYICLVLLIYVYIPCIQIYQVWWPSLCLLWWFGRRTRYLGSVRTLSKILKKK